jgi:hypothetical protein
MWLILALIVDVISPSLALRPSAQNKKKMMPEVYVKVSRQPSGDFSNSRDGWSTAIGVNVRTL